MLSAVSCPDGSDIMPYMLKLPRIKGSILEFGVYKGNSINYLAKAIPDNTIFGFDSFEGLPSAWSTLLGKGSFSLNGKLPKVRKNVFLIKGWFENTLPKFVKKNDGPCAFIHIDCDLYESTKVVLNNLKSKIVPGTIILFNEFFNLHGWQNHEYKAFCEFVEENNVEFEYLAFAFKEVGLRITTI